MRFCVSAGHGKNDPGAINEKLALKEHLEAYKLAWELRDALKAAGHSVVFISCFQNLGQKIAEVNVLHAEKPFDWAIEIHFNSAVSARARGTEVLYYSTKNVGVATRMSAAIAASLETRDRGSKKRNNLGWLTRTHPPALIVETLFINNAGDAGKIRDQRFCEKAVQGIVAVFG